MSLKLKHIKPKVRATNKSLYLHNDLIQKLQELAAAYDTSFNNIVVSIIEDFFEKEEKSQ